MGEVYLADDTLLRRPTAIKLLTSDFSQKEERLHRFEREAYAVSSLNHPNIVTIYEVGAENGHHYIATEFVDGQSLRQYARQRRLKFRDIADIAVQVASALTAAHDAGIIHRDIKPENIMIRPDGYVKVLDFGLAKLTDESSHESDAEAATQLMIKTEPGRIMGTIEYMSPEQARGKDVDQRSDIFSLGVVLYELVTGVKPFSGDTKSDVLVAVLTAEAPSLAVRRPGTPPELVRVINKCLRKDRNERYQTTKELLVDLKGLRQELEIADKFGVTHSISNVETTRTQNSRLTPPTGAYPTTLSDLLIQEVKIHPSRSLLVLIMVTILLSVAGVVIYKFARRPVPSDAFQNMRLTKVTTSGDISLINVAISPDSKYVGYAVLDGEQQSLWIRQIATTSTVQLVTPREAQFGGLAFTPDGSYLYYTVAEQGQSSTLYQVPTLGGVSRKILDDANGPVSFSPDGSRFAFRRSNEGSQLMIAKSDGSEVKQLSNHPRTEIWLTPSWSPKKQSIVAGLLSLADNKARLIEVSLEDGKETPLNTDPWLSVTSIVWTPDGAGILLAGRDLETKLFQLWFVSYPDGQRRRITNDLSGYGGVSVTGDGQTLVSVQNARSSSLWVVTRGDNSSGRKITFETGRDEGLSGITWTTDGRIIHSQRIAGTANDLWSINADGSNSFQVTNNAGRNFYPNVTHDGRFIVFISDRTGRNEVWRMDIDGRNPVQLTNSGPVSTNPSVSSDNKWVFYQRTTDSTIWKTSMDGGEPIQLTKTNSTRPLVSPRGDVFVCQLGESGSNDPPRLAVISVNGGDPVRTLDFPAVLKSGLVQWDATGDSLIYRDSRNRVDNLWSQPLNGGPPKQLTDFSSEQIFGFSWSQDGKNVVLARGRQGSDVVKITNFR